MSRVRVWAGGREGEGVGAGGFGNNGAIAGGEHSGVKRAEGEGGVNGENGGCEGGRKARNGSILHASSASVHCGCTRESLPSNGLHDSVRLSRGNKKDGHSDRKRQKTKHVEKSKSIRNNCTNSCHKISVQ